MEKEVWGVGGEEGGKRGDGGGIPVESLVAVLATESGSSRLTCELDRWLAGQAAAKGSGGEEEVRR